ncbi:MAG: POTRA domain-containing protein, partial [Gammaproteobacteria bacterium]
MRHTSLGHLIAGLLLGVLLIGPAGALRAEEKGLALRIEGLDAAAERNLRLHMGRLDPALAEQTARLERILRKDIDAALQPFGWYSASFRIVDGPGGQLLRIDPGPRVHWIAADIRMDTALRELPAIQELLRKTPFTPGSPLLHAEYDALREE